MDQNLASMRLYGEHMEEIKTRLAFIDSVTKGKMTTGAESQDAEFICLQLRKCLELIAFASLVSNQNKYSEVHADYATHWRIGKILKKLEGINPNFYPVPIVQGNSQVSGAIHFEPLSSGFLTVEEFSSLYDKCSEVLHTWNPYKNQPKIVHFGKSIDEWVARIRSLLNMHYMKAVDSDHLWIVLMNDPRDGKVHVLRAV